MAGNGRCTYDSRMGILAPSAIDERQTEEVFGMDSPRHLLGSSNLIGLPARHARLT